MASKCFTNFLLILIIRLLVGETILYPVLIGIWSAITALEIHKNLKREEEERKG